MALNGYLLAQEDLWWLKNYSKDLKKGIKIVLKGYLLA
jgi:hypothetical protein